MTTCCIMDQGLNTIRETGRPSILLWTTYSTNLHVLTPYWPHTNLVLTIITDRIQLYQLHTNHILITYQPPTNHLPTTYRPHTNHIQTTYQLHTNHIPTTYRPCYQPCYLQSHTDQVPEPHTDHVTDPMLTTNTNHILLHTDPLLTTYQCPHTKHIPTIYLLLTIMLPTTYQPLFLVQFVFIITKFNGMVMQCFINQWSEKTCYLGRGFNKLIWAFFEETPLSYKLEY